jgi:outer membrane protein assembly factor BamB
VRKLHLALAIIALAGCGESPTRPQETATLDVLWIKPAAWPWVSTPVVRDSTFFSDPTFLALDEMRISDGSLVRSISLTEPLDAHSPVIVEGGIYLGLENGAVAALDLETGGLRWATYTYPPDSISGDKHIQYQMTTPVVDAARLYVTSSEGAVHCLDRTDGRPLWRHGLGRVSVSPPLLGFGHLFVTGFSGAFEALDPLSGSIQWRKELGEEVEYTRPCAFGGRIYVGTRGGSVFCFDPENGAVVWQKRVAVQIRQNLSISDEALVVGDDSGLYAVRPSDGRALWKRPEAAHNPVQSGGLVYAHTRAGPLLLLDATTGHLVARALLPESVFFGSPVVLADRVLVPCRGYLACVAKPGQNSVVFR